MKHYKALPTLALVIFATLAIPLAAFATSAAEANICGAEEFWEGKCHSAEDWAAGWYLHPDNDPGDGSAVETAYTNFAAVIIHMPHSMCIDWRTANCDGTTPPLPPTLRKTVQVGESSTLAGRILASTAAQCIAQANLRRRIDPYCQALVDYTTVAETHADYDAEVAADKQTFEDGIYTRSECAVEAAFINSNATDFTNGALSDSEFSDFLDAIVAVNSWACETFHNQTPPTIPDPPSQ